MFIILSTLLAKWQESSFLNGSLMSAVDLNPLLASQYNAKRRAMFALLVLGVVESISSGVLSATGAVQTFFTANNCLFVKKTLKNRIADEIMSRGVQLPDLFDALSPDEAARELRDELRTMQELSRSLLDRTPLAA